jgi:EmrB/QacA subfamily drug resistance transporter
VPVPAPAPAAVHRRPGLVLATIVLVQLLFGIDSSVTNVALPTIGAELGLDVVAQSWVQTAYLLAFGGLLLLGGRLGAMAGRRRLLVVGVLVFTAASALGGLADSAAMLVAARAAQGVGAALAAPNTLALLMATFAPGAPRDRALAVFSAVLGTGATLGLVLGGLLTSGASWRWVLLVNVPLGLLIAVAAPRALPETDRVPGGLDVLGVVTSAVGLAALVFGLTRAAGAGWADPATPGALVVAVLALGGFFAVERRARLPILPLEVVLDRARGTGYLAAATMAGAMFGAFFLLTQFLQEVMGLGALAAGLALVPLMGGMLVTVRLVPRVLARTRPSTPVLVGAALFAVGAAWLARLPADPDYVLDLLGPMLLVGVAGGMSFVPLSSSILAGITPAHAGAASGALQVLQYAGTALGVAGAVTVYGAARQAGADLAPAIDAGIAASAVLAVATGVLALVRRRWERPVSAAAGSTPRPPRRG